MIFQLEYLMSGLIDPALVQKSVEAIAQMDRQLEPWKNDRANSGPTGQPDVIMQSCDMCVLHTVLSAPLDQQVTRAPHSKFSPWEAVSVVTILAADMRCLNMHDSLLLTSVSLPKVYIIYRSFRPFLHLTQVCATCRQETDENVAPDTDAPAYSLGQGPASKKPKLDAECVASPAAAAATTCPVLRQHPNVFKALLQACQGIASNPIPHLHNSSAVTSSAADSSLVSSW